jgi:hypothetical protein
MSLTYRTAAAAVAAGLAMGAAMFGAAAPASAQNLDKQFADDVAALQIPIPDGVDLPALGHGVCDLLTGGLTGNPNPVPVVRGVVSKLESGGLSRQEAARLMRAAVVVYCPQHARYLGR